MMEYTTKPCNRYDFIALMRSLDRVADNIELIRQAFYSDPDMVDNYTSADLKRERHIDNGIKQLVDAIDSMQRYGETCGYDRKSWQQ